MSALDEFVEHGGRLALAQSLFRSAPVPWIDLSTGINPHSFRVRVATRIERNRLPQVDDLRELARRAGAVFGVDDPSRVVPVPGSETALRLLPYVLNLTNALVIGPTYGSHAAAWRKGAAVRPVSSEEPLNQESTPARAALIVVNPNNPDGKTLTMDRLQSLHDTMQAQGGAIIVDEAFADATPQISVASRAGSARAPRMIVLRSFGKFYGLAGLRLGFLIAAPAIATALREAMGDWPVSADAMVAGLAAYADHEWAERARRSLGCEAKRLDRILMAAGFEIMGGTSLFRLARSDEAPRRFQALLSAGILCRPFAHDRSLLRFGLPGSPMARRRLAAALA